MITVFNRRELTVTMDMRRQADIARALSKADIPYTIRTKDLQNAPLMGGSGRGHLGSFGVNQDFSCEYKFFVRREDYERAAALIR